MPLPTALDQTDICPFFEIRGGLRERALNQSPVLSRVPLVRWQPGMRYLRGTGNITPVKLASILAALLRFEFLSDCSERAEGGSALSDGLIDQSLFRQFGEVRKQRAACRIGPDEDLERL